METFLNRVHPQDMELIMKVAEEALSEQKPYNIEHRIVLPSGEERIVHVQAEATFGESGMPIRVIGTVHDITERKRLEESIRENERLLKAVLKTLPVGVWIADRKGRILQSNPAAQQIWAGTKYVGVDQYGEYKGWWADTGELIRPEEWALARAITKGEVSINEKVEIECFDGTHKIILNSALPIRNDYNEITGAIVVNQDITEQRRAEKALRESEERYRTLVENAPEAIVVLDVESGHFTDVNENAARLFKLTRDELLGCRPVDLSPPLQPYGRPSSESAWEKIREAINGEAPTFEWTHRNAEGECIPCEVSLVRLPSTARNLIRGSVVNITDRKRMEEERLQLDKLESVGVLAGGIAHDFNNLLAAILTTVSLAKVNTHPESNVYENLIDAEKACHQAKRLTQQLLTFSRGGAPIKKLTSVKQILEESPRFALRGFKSRCDFNIGEDLWDVEVDEGQISQVINNLIINADQAMPGGGLITVSAENITVRAEHSPPLRSGMYIKVTIEDKGVGIPKEHLAKIFDPYFTTKQRGSGLGLATVYSIVKGHNGYIGVESELGAGTKFYIYLPASSERVEKRGRAGKRKRVGRGKKANGRRRILLMDDEAIARMTAGKALIDMGYDVEYAGDGEEAIELYKRAKESGKPFDVVIMDLTIPGGMGGKEAIGQLISIDPGVKAVVSSGYSNDPLMSEFRDYGFKGIIAKPYEIEELAEVLKKVINEL